MNRLTKILLSFLLLTAMYAPTLVAQAPPVPVKENEGPVKNIIKLSPFHFAEGTFLMSYERMLGEQKSSLMLNLGLHSSNSRNFSTGQATPEFGFQEELQYRVYVVPPQDYSRSGRGFWYFKGFYAGPYVSHRTLQRSVQVWDWILQQNVDEKENLNEAAGGVILGAQIAMGNKFFIDFYTGGGVKRSFGQIRQTGFIGVTQPGYNGVYPKIGFQIGIGI
jgi:hypothetical protein